MLTSGSRTDSIPGSMASGLWADGWFYISSAGLLVSGVLFFFLLGQYRAAAQAVDEDEPGQPSSEPAVAPEAQPESVLASPEPEAAPQVASVVAEAVSAPEQAPVDLGPIMARLEKMAAQDKVILDRLAELARAVADLKSSASKPDPVPIVEISVPVPVPTPTPTPVPAPVPETPVLAAAPAQSPAVEPAPAPEPEKPRRGPVWPV